MKNILYVVSSLKKSGPTNQLSYIIKFLDKKLFNPIILTLSDEPKDSMKSYFEEELNVRVESLKLSRLKGILKGKSLLNEFVKENKIDIFHTQGIRADGLVSRMKIPKVSTIRNFPKEDYIMKFGSFKGGVMAYTHIKNIKNNFKDFVACSKTVKQQFMRRGIDIKFIQNGVDTEKYIPGDRIEMREKLGLPKDKKIFIVIGSLISRKNNRTIIKAFNKIKNNEYLLLFVGDGIEKQLLKNEVEETNTQFLGNISNVKEYLIASDVFISASLSEGLPNTVLEAMAIGLPVILSDIPSHRELYLEGELHKGLFFEANNHLQLINLIENTSKEEIEKNEKQNLLLIQNIFSAKMMSMKYQKLYKEKI